MGRNAGLFLKKRTRCAEVASGLWLTEGYALIEGCNGKMKNVADTRGFGMATDSDI